MRAFVPSAAASLRQALPSSSGSLAILAAIRPRPGIFRVPFGHSAKVIGLMHEQ